VQSRMYLDQVQVEHTIGHGLQWELVGVYDPEIYNDGYADDDLYSKQPSDTKRYLP
jgi:hypothetical protein